MHEFQFHEDDPGQISLQPYANRHYYQREFPAMQEFAGRHRAPGGIGWTKVYRPSPDKDRVTLRSLDITEGRFIELLTPCSKQFDRLVSALSEFDAELGIRSVGFGPSAHCGIVADLDGGYVKSIWCLFLDSSAAAKAEIGNMLTALSTDHHLLLVDWSVPCMVDLRDREEIERYLGVRP